MPRPYEMTPLQMLPVGGIARIGQLLGEVDQVHRLEELGLRRGAVIEMIRSGSPCIVCVDGCRLCFRSSDLLCVLVSREDAA